MFRKNNQCESAAGAPLGPGRVTMGRLLVFAFVVAAPRQAWADAGCGGFFDAFPICALLNLMAVLVFSLPFFLGAATILLALKLATGIKVGKQLAISFGVAFLSVLVAFSFSHAILPDPWGVAASVAIPLGAQVALIIRCVILTLRTRRGRGC